MLGLVGADSGSAKVPMEGLEGKHGVEMLDSVLEGARGWRETETDRGRRELWPIVAMTSSRVTG